MYHQYLEYRIKWKKIIRYCQHICKQNILSSYHFIKRIWKQGTWNTERPVKLLGWTKSIQADNSGWYMQQNIEMEFNEVQKKEAKSPNYTYHLNVNHIIITRCHGSGKQQQRQSIHQQCTIWNPFTILVIYR